MTRRPAVTLLEVLVSMFIMAIGMLALLTLFPLGAISMGQALKDDRCAATAAMAENVAIAKNIRHDANVLTAFTASGGAPVYVDPYGVLQGLPLLGGVIHRVNPSFTTTPALADRWFSLPDDITFSESGTPDLSGGSVDRGRRYSYTYLLRRLQPTVDDLVNLTVVVYSGRPVGSLTLEQTVPATGGTGANGITVLAATSIKRGGWVLDPVNAYFYRVTNLTDVGGSTVVDVQPNLIAPVTVMTVMDNVAEVFDKGNSWQP